ncbi:MAG: leucyl/phenylalanyl-tRNA--protein transferase [Vicinamibacterales bacterium]
MIPLLDPAEAFPPVEEALDEPNGLLAAGGSLAVPRLIDAYARGIFPRFSAGDPGLWWSPDPRMVLEADDLRVSRSLRKRLRRRDYEVTADRAFGAVIRACAAPRAGEDGTWLVPSMIDAYERMHAAGLAHSVEVWMEGALVGGLYGVALGRMFFGESMFTRRTDGSKIAFVHLVEQLRRWGGPLVDCQLRTAHLASLGAREIPRREFVRRVGALVRETPFPAPWRFDADLAASFDAPTR